jgi:hypothetical protein
MFRLDSNIGEHDFRSYAMLHALCSMLYAILGRMTAEHGNRYSTMAEN